jgi:hypothetical protein
MLVYVHHMVIVVDHALLQNMNKIMLAYSPPPRVAFNAPCTGCWNFLTHVQWVGYNAAPEIDLCLHHQPQTPDLHLPVHVPPQVHHSDS